MEPLQNNTPNTPTKLQLLDLAAKDVISHVLNDPHYNLTKWLKDGGKAYPSLTRSELSRVWAKGQSALIEELGNFVDVKGEAYKSLMVYKDILEKQLNGIDKAMAVRTKDGIEVVNVPVVDLRGAVKTQEKIDELLGIQKQYDKDLHGTSMPASVADEITKKLGVLGYMDPVVGEAPTPTPLNIPPLNNNNKNKDV